MPDSTRYSRLILVDDLHGMGWQKSTNNIDKSYWNMLFQWTWYGESVEGNVVAMIVTARNAIMKPHGLKMYRDVLQYMNVLYTFINTLTPRQNGCHFADDIFICIFLNENVIIMAIF